MADTDVRILRDVETCVDDSPPVCLVPLVHNKLVSQRSPDRCNHRDLGNACDKSSATASDMSPTVIQATPELTLTLQASATESMASVTESKEQQFSELSVLDSVHKDVAVEQAKEQTSCGDSAAVVPEMVEIGRKRVTLASQDNLRIAGGCPSQSESEINPPAPFTDNLATADHPETCDQIGFPTLPETAERDEEDDDFDLDDRPLTVDISLAPDTTPEDRNAGKEMTTSATERETQNVVPAEPVYMASESGPTTLSSSHPAPIQPTEDTITSINGPSDDCQPDPRSTIAEVLTSLHSPSNRNHLPETPPNSTITNTVMVGSPLQQNGVDLSYPTVSLTNKAETSVVFVTCLQPFTTPITSVLDIRPKPATPQPTVLPVSSSATLTVASSSTALLTSQPNTAQLMSFATGTGVSSAGVPLSSLPVTATALPLPGSGVGSGSTLQFLNMTPMPQFLGAPGIVLHSAGAPTFQSPATPLLPGLSTPGLGAGTALNFLQPNNQPFTTMLQPPMGTGGDFLFDTSLGLSHQIVPTSSIALFSPVSCCSSMVESYAPTHLSPFYPTLVQPPHNPSLLPTSTSVFIPPNYRPPSTVVTNLVNATTSQMATSMSGSAGPNIFPAPTLSLAGNPSVGSSSLFLQTAPAPLISPPFGPGTTPLFQCPFSSYSIPLQGSTEACLPSTIAAGLTTKTTSVYRIDDLNIASPSGVSVLPPLWTAPSTLPTLCPTPQPAPTAPSVPIASSSSGVVNIAPLLPQPPTLQPCPAVSKQLRRFQAPNLPGRSAQPTMRAGGASTSVTNVLPKTTSLPSTSRLAGNVGIVMPNSTTILPPIRRRRPLLHPVKSKQPSVGLQLSTGPSLPSSDGENQSGTVGIVGPADRTPSGTPTDTAGIHLSTDTASSLYANSGETIPADNSPSKCSSSVSPVPVRTSPVPSASDRRHSGSAAPPNESTRSPIQEEPSAGFLSHPIVTHHSQANESFDPSGSSRTASSPVKTSLPSPQQSPIGATHRSSNSAISSSTRSSSGCNSSSTSPANQRKGPSPVASPSTSYPPKTSTVNHENVEFHSSLERLGMSFKSATHGIYRGNNTTPLEATGLLPVHRKSSTASAHGGSQKMPPPLLHHGPEGLRIWMHVVGGHVIYESNKPFPVKNGMSVVEAALLNECLNEEKEVIGDTVSPHKKPNEPNVPVLNGHEPMQLESELEEPKSSVSLSDNKGDASNKRLSGTVETGEKLQPTVFERLSNGPSNMVEMEPVKANGPEFTSKPSKGTGESLALSHEVQVSTGTGFPLHTIGASGDEMFSRGVNSGPAIRVPTSAMSSSISTAPSLTDASSSSAPTFAQSRPPMQQSGFFPFAQHSHTPQLPTPPPPGPVRKWTPEDVVAFVQGTPGCAAYASAFLTNEIDGEALLLLAKDQFIHPPIGMKIGPALKLAARLESIRHIN